MYGLVGRDPKFLEILMRSGQRSDSLTQSVISMSEEVLNELQLLLAMYDKADLSFHDPEVLHLVENCIPISDSVSLTLRLNESVQLDIRLPLGYPEKERLSAHCRLCRKNPVSHLEGESVKQWESQFNKGLCQEYLQKDKDEEDRPNILGVIQWCNEQFEINPIPTESNSNFSKTIGDPSANRDLISESSSLSTSCRIWIFSHHIYNKNKRKFLVNTAGELDLSGFSLPGKPGFICVEGDPSSCDEYWSRVRQLTWQKISLIERQSFPSTEIIFEDKPFEELRCDKSAFIKWLEEKNSSSIIKDYLGI